MPSLTSFRKSLAVYSFALLASANALATDRDRPLPIHQDSRLTAAFTSDRIWNSMATTTDGTCFFVYTGSDSPGIQLARMRVDGQRTAFPDQRWNRRAAGEDIADVFVHLNAVRIGPDGDVWVVDAGSPTPGGAAVPGAARLFRFDPDTGALLHAYSLAGGVRPDSFIDDFRFHGRRVYLTDAGHGALLVLDLGSGRVRRLLEGDPSVTAQAPIRVVHRGVRDSAGNTLTVHADQLEVSPDGRYLYFQPLSGKMSRLGTHWLDDPGVSARTLASHVQPWFDSPSTGGTAIDAAGNIYLTDSNNQRILMISPGRRVSVLVSDPRLLWPDTMWLDRRGHLFIPATQLHLTPNFNDGRNEVQYPVAMLKIDIAARPGKMDHP